MELYLKIKKKFINFNLIIYLFLIWNAFKLFLINSDPIIQILNLLLSLGIYFCLEDKNLQIKSKKRLSFFIGLVGTAITFCRFYILNTLEDKYYYFNLPIGIFFLIIILKPFNQFFYFKEIFFISLLLPIRRIFFEFANYLLGSLVPYLTWFVLFCIGKNPIIDGENIFIANHQLVLGKGCLGSDNLYFVLATLFIYFVIFRLRKFNNIGIIISFSIIISIFINILRNTILALLVSSLLPYKDEIFYFLHDSYGSLMFTFFSVYIISFMYFKLLDKELSTY